MVRYKSVTILGFILDLCYTNLNCLNTFNLLPLILRNLSEVGEKYMLKQVLYCLMLFMTVIRAGDMGYILIKGSTNIPIPVIAVTSCVILYGAVLLIRRLFVNVTLKQMMAYFSIETLAIIFNLIYIATNCPLKISAAETLVVGTFFNIIVNLSVLYFSTKQLRSHYFAIAQPVTSSNRHA